MYISYKKWEQVITKIRSKLEIPKGTFRKFIFLLINKFAKTLEMEDIWKRRTDENSFNKKNHTLARK